jgi:hypothetical protein
VEKVKGPSALVNGEDLPLNIGDEFYTLNDSGRKTGWIRIKQVKNNRAVAVVVKGVVVAGEKLVPKAGSPEGASEAAASDEDSSSPRSRGREAWGLLGGYSMDSMSFTAGDSSNPPVHTEKASLSGSSFKLKGFYDRPFGQSFTLRFMGGLDGFNGTYGAQSTVINRNSSSTSSVSVTFLALEAEIQWNLYKKSLTTFWLGGGYSFQYAMSSTTNMYSLQMNSSYTNSLFIGGGSNIKMNATHFIPLFVHYNYYVAGSGITQTAINLYGGYGWLF